jgi:hypothetical protein
MTDDKDELIRQLTIRLRETVDENDRLRAVVAKLTGTDDAHSTLRRLYLDEAQNPGHRIRAAQAALNVEKPSLKPQPAPLELTAEPYEPLSVVVERQRARMNRILALPLEERERMIAGVARGDGNGSDD